MRRFLEQKQGFRLTSMRTICDGIAVKQARELTFPLVRQHVDLFDQRLG
jgi:threonine dehydratase